MDIAKYIDRFNSETDECVISKIIDDFRDNYLVYFANVDKVTSKRKLALSMSMLSRKKQIQDYMLSSQNILDLLHTLSSDEDVKVRKNIYSTYANIGIHIDDFYALLDREESYINILHLLDIMAKHDDVDIAKLEAKVETIDKRLTQYEKAKAILSRLRLRRADRLYLKNVKKNDFLLLTVPKYGAKVLEDDLNMFNIKVAEKCQSGLIISGKNELKYIESVRSYFEMLIAPCKKYKVANDMTQIADRVSEILDLNYFNDIFDADRSKYSYRLEIKNVDNDTRAKLSKYIVANVRAREFVNIRDDYDIEIRIIPSGKTADIFVKVPYKDTRFDYRKNELPASISPVTASIIAGLIKPYVDDFDYVLDTFVGTGTMLYEFYLRHGEGKYIGVDIENNAIRMAKENIGDKIKDICLECADATKYMPQNKADIIISNMPFGTRVLRHDSIVELYKKYFARIDSLLKDNGKAFLLTTNGKALRENVYLNGYKILREFRVDSGGLMPYLFVISK